MSLLRPVMNGLRRTSRISRPEQQEQPAATEGNLVHLPSAGSSRSDVDRRALELPPGFTWEAQQVREDPAQPGLDELRIQRLMTAAIKRWGWLTR